jgi:hypothetical protein
MQLLIASQSGRETFDSQGSSGHGKHSRNMKIAMRIHPQYRLYGVRG